METPLRGRSGGHIGTAPTVSLERIARGCSPLQFRLGRLRVERLVGLSRLRVERLVPFGENCA